MNTYGPIHTAYGLATIEQVNYANNNRIALRLIDERDGTPISILTCNLPHVHLEPGEFCVKTWSENEQIAKNCMDSGLFIDTGKRFPTGHCVAEVWRFKE